MINLDKSFSTSNLDQTTRCRVFKPVAKSSLPDLFRKAIPKREVLPTLGGHETHERAKSFLLLVSSLEGVLPSLLEKVMPNVLSDLTETLATRRGQNKPLPLKPELARPVLSKTK